jgi:hypothetical protein
VPGTWVEPPAVGLLWTPGYWGWHDGIYAWNAGYWGPHIGFYGGINYGFGYTGVGHAGGFWRGGVFSYNRTVNNFGSVRITNTYNKTVINNTTVRDVSFNGGADGTTAKATPQELAATHSGQFSDAGVVGAGTAATGPAGRNPAAGATPNRGPTGAVNSPGAGNRPNTPGGAGPGRVTGPGGPRTANVARHNPANSGAPRAGGGPRPGGPHPAKEHH